MTKGRVEAAYRIWGAHRVLLIILLPLFPTLTSIPIRIITMANQSRAQAPPIPQVLAHLVRLNVEFQVLVCLSEECRCAVSPRAIVRHLYLQHKTPIELRKVIERYIQAFSGSYDYLSVQLLPDGSSPQPIIQVVDGFRCRQCVKGQSNRGNIEYKGMKY
jgi:hypothetical protein